MDRRFRWAALPAAVIGAAAIAVVSYNVGMSHALAMSAAAGTAAGAPAYVPPYYWYRPWGFGLLGPFVFILFWFLIARLFFWGGFYRRRWYYGGPYGPGSLDEWHRRAHERERSRNSEIGSRKSEV
jgi:hypothetical protein